MHLFPEVVQKHFFKIYLRCVGGRIPSVCWEPGCILRPVTSRGCAAEGCGKGGTRPQLLPDWGFGFAASLVLLPAAEPHCQHKTRWRREICWEENWCT